MLSIAGVDIFSKDDWAIPKDDVSKGEGGETIVILGDSVLAGSYGINNECERNLECFLQGSEKQLLNSLLLFAALGDHGIQSIIVQ